MSASRQPPLNPEQWAQVRALFEECLPLAPAERAVLIEQKTRGQAWLRREVETLLANTGAAEKSFLGPPLLKQMSKTSARTVTTPDWATQTFSPQRLGKYLLLYRLGHGGMAEVFLAKATGPNNFERLVALKKILPDHASDPNFRADFESEARLNSRLTHANIVHLYDFGVHDGSYVLAMEYVNGVNLADVIDHAQARGVRVPVDLSLYLVARLKNFGAGG